MGVKEETSLQERIQKLIEARGGYVNKNWGSMISKPGIADLTACYKGLYLALEVKVGDNKPTPAQGIHARKVDKALGITAAVWSTEEVEKILDIIDKNIKDWPHLHLLADISQDLCEAKIDDGTRY